MLKLRMYLMIAGISLLVNVAMFGVGAYKGYGWGADKVQKKWNAAVLEKTKEKIDTKVKQDEIQTAPLDSRVVNRRLRNDTF